jgi:hypothetical protein
VGFFFGTKDKFLFGFFWERFEGWCDFLVGGGTPAMRGFSTSPDVANAPEGWVVEYGPMSIDCRDEEDAKRIVRSLRRRKGRVVARTAGGVSPRRWFEGADLTKWLSGSPP